MLSTVGQKNLIKLNKRHGKPSLKQTKHKISGFHGNKYEVSSKMLHCAGL
jgi:hypothetical protein